MYFCLPSVEGSCVVLEFVGTSVDVSSPSEVLVNWLIPDCNSSKDGNSKFVSSSIVTCYLIHS